MIKWLVILVLVLPMVSADAELFVPSFGDDQFLMPLFYGDTELGHFFSDDVCGNGICFGTETCNSCSADCGNCQSGGTGMVGDGGMPNRVVLAINESLYGDNPPVVLTRVIDGGVKVSTLVGVALLVSAVFLALKDDEEEEEGLDKDLLDEHFDKKGGGL